MIDRFVGRQSMSIEHYNWPAIINVISRCLYYCIVEKLLYCCSAVENLEKPPFCELWSLE